MSPFRHSLPALCAPALAASLLLGGCGGDERGPYPVEPGRERERAERPVPPDATTQERLLPPTLIWEAPPKWIEQPPGQMRLASFRVPGEGGRDGDISLSSAGGGLAGNVNRWRKQMGLPEATGAELSSLRKQRLMDLEASRVDLRGTFTPMGGEPQPGARLLGLIAEGDDESLFVKFVGPEALVTANEVAFDTFVDSVRLGHWRSRPPPSPSREPAPQPTGQIRWELPKGWTESPPTSGMRVGEFRITDAPDVEVVLTRLQGNGGGVDWNVNRWREQMGAAVLSADEIGRLERMDVLGVKAVWVEIPGRYRGQAGEDIPDALFVGVICVLPTDSVFARLYGPRAGVERSRDAFRAFCRSLRLETGR